MLLKQGFEEVDYCKGIALIVEAAAEENADAKSYLGSTLSPQLLELKKHTDLK